MAAQRYRVTQLSYIDSNLRHPGEEVEIDLGGGKPGPNLELIEDEGAPAKGKGKSKAAAAADTQADTTGGDLV